MKRLFFVPALLAAALASAQNQTYINTSGGMYGNMMYSKKAQSESALGSQYFDEHFQLAKLDDNPETFVARHNAYTDEIEVKVNEEIKVIQPVNGTTVTFTANGLSYEYLRYTDKENVANQHFLMLISGNPNVKVYKRERIYLQPEQHPTGGYQKYKAPAYKKMDPEYYIKIKNGSIVYLPTKKSDLVDMFPQKEKEIKAFLKENKISASNEQDIAKLGTFLNTII